MVAWLVPSAACQNVVPIASPMPEQALTPTVETTSEITYKTDITPAPTATAEPVATENIMSEVPENVHIDEQSQTVTIGYDDGGITYEGAKYIL